MYTKENPMKKALTLAALIAVVTLGGTSANAVVGNESHQNLNYYAPMATGVMVNGMGMGCNTGCNTGCNSCACPMTCPCMPTCCPANRGIFDGGLNKCCPEMECPKTCDPCGRRGFFSWLGW